MVVIASDSIVSTRHTRLRSSREKARKQHDHAVSSPFLDLIPGEIRNQIYTYFVDKVPVKIKKSRAIHPRYEGLRSLTEASKRIRAESLPLYLKNQFQHTYTTAASLEKFLKSPFLALTKDTKVKLLIFFQFSYPDLDFLPIFELIAATTLEGLEVSFECKTWSSITAGIMNRAIQQKTLWQGSTSRVERISCYGKRDTSATVHLPQGPCWSQQEKDERNKAFEIWKSLRFAVPYYNGP